MVDRISGQGNTSTVDFLSKFTSMFYDRDFDVLKALHAKMWEKEIQMTALIHNYFILNAL